MLYHLFRVVGTQEEESYKRRIPEEGITCWDRQRLRVHFPDFGAKLATGLLDIHRQTQHGV